MKIEELHEGNYSYEIYKENYEPHFSVLFYKNGINIEWMTYYTNDKKDARKEAKSQLLDFARMVNDKAIL